MFGEMQGGKPHRAFTKKGSRQMYAFQLIGQNQCGFYLDFQTKKVQTTVLAVPKRRAAMPLECDMAARDLIGQRLNRFNRFSLI